MGGGLRRSGPRQQAADRTALVKGVKQPLHLVAVPDLAALELRQGDVAADDVDRMMEIFMNQVWMKSGCAAGTPQQSGQATSG